MLTFHPWNLIKNIYHKRFSHPNTLNISEGSQPFLKSYVSTFCIYSICLFNKSCFSPDNRDNLIISYMSSALITFKN